MPWTRLAKQFHEKKNLSLKNATKLSKARYNATKNPFVIFHWFDLLEETIRKLGTVDRPDLTWNSNESGLPHDPKKCKFVSLKGQKTMQIVTGSDRDNTTVLAAVSATWAVLPPLIIFRVSRFKRHGGCLLLQIISSIHGFMLTKKVG